MEGKFSDVIVIGFGKIVSDVLKYVIEQRKKWNYAITFIAYETYPTSNVKKICSENAVEFEELHEQVDITEYLLKQDKKTLIISAGNKYIFPKKVIEKSNVKIINFHNALLPAYPGRNAPSWAIWGNEKVSGATWHYVTEGIDAGDCLWQKECLIGEDTKAYELVREIMILAKEGFEEIFPELLADNAKSKAFASSDTRRIYYSYEIPNDGYIKISDSPHDIYRLLRATDFGVNRLFPNILCEMGTGEVVEILTYKKEVCEKKISIPIVDYVNKQILLRLDSLYKLRIRFR